MKLAVVVPFLDEEEYLGTLLESIEQQTRPPDRLLLVDDGSRDRSGEIADGFAAAHAFATVIHRPRRPPARDRLASAPELRAFQDAVAELGGDYDVVAKLDADLRLPPAMFEELEREFRGDPRLGLAGAHLSEEQADGTLLRHRAPPGNVEGATKFFRRECLEAISPVPAILGWDTIDEARARMHGWRTASFAISGGDPIHLRRAWAGDGVLRGYRRAGRAAYGYGTHPLVVLLSALARMRDRPALLCGLNYLVGWAVAGVRRYPRAEPELRRFYRREQFRRLAGVIRGGGVRSRARPPRPTRLCMVVHGRYPLDPRVARAVTMAQSGGFEVDVVCLQEPGRPAHEVVGGARVHRLPVTHRRGIGAVRLLLEYLSFTFLATLTVAVRGGLRGYDIVHVNNPPDFLVAAALVPRLRGARVIFDVHDRVPLMYAARFGGSESLVVRLLTAVEVAACRFAHGVVTVHDPYLRELEANGIPAERITVVMNTPNEKLIAEALERAASVPAGRRDGWQAIYHGTITEWYGVPFLIRAAAVARDGIDGFRLTVIGGGDDLERAREVAAEIGMDETVTFSGGYLPIDQVLDAAAAADCGVVPNLPSPLNDLTLSSKLLEYVALGVPVVVSRLRTLAAHFDDDEVTFFTPTDVDDLARALRWVAENPEPARAKAERARARAQAYGFAENSRRYVALLDALSPASRSA